MKNTTAFGIIALTALGAMLMPAVSTLADEAAVVTIKPQETDAILANPGMGWQTFHRTRTQDKSLPAWIPSTVHYARWGWGELEQQPGKLNTDFLDKVLSETREAGQQLAFRVMCCSSSKGRPYHPHWIKEVGGRELICDYEGQGPLPIPDLDDPIVLSRHLDFIKRLGARYDGHADIDHVDLGSVGWWGEWHLSGSKNCKLTSLDARNQIVDAYLSAFQKTPLLMLIGGGESLKRATQKGAGWRADCLGDMGGFSRNWSHMRQGYPHWLREAGIAETWKTAPVAWESCWDMRKWVSEGWPLRYIFNYALAMHGSQLNNKSAPLPTGGDVRAETERFLRRLGYRFVLKELKHPADVKAGKAFEATMQWQNAGSAPCYRPYRLAYRLKGSDGTEKVIVGRATVDRWMPGTVDVLTEDFLKSPPDLPLGDVVNVVDAIAVPQDLPAGKYELAIAVIGVQSTQPAMQLGIAGRAADGWYPLSRIRVR
jgi:hypothetical protein